MSHHNARYRFQEIFQAVALTTPHHTICLCNITRINQHQTIPDVPWNSNRKETNRFFHNLEFHSSIGSGRQCN